MSSAIPAAHIEAMTMQVWDNLERRYPFRRNRPDTWTAQRIYGLHALDKSVTFEQIGSPMVSRMFDDIIGSGNWQRPIRWGSLLVAFPESSGQWALPYISWHLDFPGDPLEPLPALRVFTCLLPLRHGGGATLVVAGSHLLVENLAKKNANRRLHSADIRTALIGRYLWIKALCSRSETANRIERFMNVSTIVDGAELRVIEMTGDPGDVFFVHPLMLHAPSTNCAAVPRMVLSSFVYRNGVESGAMYQG
ncbi:MAG: phytanoyl-CoA dioxygenase family protein [Deltaproteobacteria bacterium]|nr:phytanoyl-CoA dioxygenase family protein [Deltaproteobacteria bacterium]